MDWGYMKPFLGTPILPGSQSWGKLQGWEFEGNFETGVTSRKPGTWKSEDSRMDDLRWDKRGAHAGGSQSGGEARGADQGGGWLGRWCRRGKCHLSCEFLSLSIGFRVGWAPQLRGYALDFWQWEFICNSKLTKTSPQHKETQLTLKLSHFPDYPKDWSCGVRKGRLQLQIAGGFQACYINKLEKMKFECAKSWFPKVYKVWTRWMSASWVKHELQNMIFKSL